jgi:hypothetical protein
MDGLLTDGDVGRLFGIEGLLTEGRATEGGIAGRLTAGLLMVGRPVLGRDAGREPPRLGWLGRDTGRTGGRDPDRAVDCWPPRFGGPFRPASRSPTTVKQVIAAQAMHLMYTLIGVLLW